MRRRITIQLWSVLALMLLFNTGMKAQWEEVFTGSGYFMRDICFVPGSDGLWQEGWAIAYEGDIFKTTDGGDTWSTITQSFSTALAGIDFPNSDTGYICTLDNKILMSTDGGNNWSVSYNGSVNFDKIAFRDGLNGVASGTFKLYTNDGGTTWTTGSGGSSYWDLDHGSGDYYYGVNLGGSLGKTTDGGANWSDVGSLGVMCMMVDFMDSDHGMFGGDLSTIKVTHDGGGTWSTNTLGGGQDAINCGGFFDADTIYAAGSSGEVFKTTDGGTTWDADTSWSSGVFMPRGLVVTGMNTIFACGSNSSSEGLIWRKVGPPPIDAEFEADSEVVCAGSSVDFTDLSYGAIDSWTWHFEGGTPATSTDQNPTVTYSNAGTYDVKLVVTVGSIADSITKSDYIEVVLLPTQADAPTGDEEVCTGMTYFYSIPEVTYASDYEWEIDPADAGTITADGTEATLETDDSWTGDFTIKVRATNVCGAGDWSDDLEGTLYISPEDFNLEGGGSYCLGGDGVEITLSNSQTGIDYELFLDGETTGMVVAGTGSELSFGMHTDEGYYTAEASNDNCMLTMTGQVQVWIDFPPTEPGTPEGPDVVCNDMISDYESDGADDADSYVWVLTPEDAGTLTANGLNATVEWNAEFDGIAEVALYGINDCGDGNYSQALEVAVDALPAPEIAGEDYVCDDQVELYEVVENEGSIYMWEVTGGTLTAGDSTYSVTVTWGEVGSGTLSVTEITEAGCEGQSETFDVTIDDCTSIGESTLESTTKIYPNPADNYFNIRSGAESFDLTVYTFGGGKILERSEIKGETRIDTGDLAPGIYLVKLMTQDEVITKRLIIQ